MLRRRLIWTVAVLLAIAAPISATEVVRVVAVVDGDTIKVSLGGGVETVRLIGVDTPETVHPSKPVEFFGKEASTFTQGQALGKFVRLERDLGSANRDRYQRLLRYVYVLPDGVLINAEIIRQGYGHAYTVFPFSKMEEFRALEREAREASRGLWGAESIPPAPTSGLPDEADATVYITQTGQQDHRACCRYLARSKISISIAGAVARGRGPCSIRQTPQLGDSLALRDAAHNTAGFARMAETRERSAFPIAQAHFRASVFWLLPWRRGRGAGRSRIPAAQAGRRRTRHRRGYRRGAMISNDHELEATRSARALPGTGDAPAEGGDEPGQLPPVGVEVDSGDRPDVARGARTTGRGSRSCGTSGSSSRRSSTTTRIGGTGQQSGGDPGQEAHPWRSWRPSTTTAHPFTVITNHSRFGLSLNRARSCLLPLIPPKGQAPALGAHSWPVAITPVAYGREQGLPATDARSQRRVATPGPSDSPHSHA